MRFCNNLFIILLFQLIYCNIKADNNNNFIINGVVHDSFDNYIVKLCLIEDDIQKVIALDTIKNKKFKFEGTENLSTVAFVLLDDSSHSLSCDVFMERGNINILLDGLSYAKDTELNDLHSDYMLECRAMEVILEQEYYDQIDQKDNPNTLKFDSLMNILTDYKISFQIKNMHNIVGQTLFIREISSFWNPSFLDLYESLPSDIKKNPKVDNYYKMRIEMQESQKRIDAEIGLFVKDAQFSTKDKNSKSLSDFLYKSKYLYIDIWASWCVPCIQEFPDLKLIHNKYKDLGFDVILISIDTNLDSCIDAIERNEITFETLVDLSGGKILDSILAFSLIPHGVLIDQDGIIIANQLNKASLKKKLFELYGE